MTLDVVMERNCVLDMMSFSCELTTLASWPKIVSLCALTVHIVETCFEVSEEISGKRKKF
jgi:hypothetical protein